MRKVLIIGANRGIGLALAEVFKQNDYHVIATCRSSSKELNQLEVEVIEGISVMDDQSILALKEKVSDLDCLIHNAGILCSESLSQLKENFDFSSIEEQFHVNAIAPLKVAVALCDKIKAGGKLAFITSRMGSIADNNSGGTYGYRASRTALNMFAKSLSIDLKEQEIAVGALHPGWVKTRMTQGKGLIEAKESAEGLFDRIYELNLENSGGFWHTSGERLAW